MIINKYIIGNIRLIVQTQDNFQHSRQFDSFRINYDGDADFDIKFYPVSDPVINDQSISNIDFYLDKALLKNDVSYLGIHFGKKPCHAWVSVAGKNVNVYYLNDFNYYFPTERQIFGPICIENILSLRMGFILHSSFVCWKGKGILFTGPSGIGKSTQAELWTKYCDAEILNGDRSGVRRENGKWNAYGLPYAGSSSIYRNESCEISAIIVLSQSKENRLTRMDSLSSYKAIYSQMTLHPWDKSFMERVLDVLNNLICEVPVYHFACRADESAVKLLKNEIEDINDKQ